MVPGGGDVLLQQRDASSCSCCCLLQTAWSQDLALLAALSAKAKKLGWLMDHNEDRYKYVFVILTVKQFQIEAFVRTHSSE